MRPTDARVDAHLLMASLTSSLRRAIAKKLKAVALCDLPRESPY